PRRGPPRRPTTPPAPPRWAVPPPTTPTSRRPAPPAPPRGSPVRPSGWSSSAAPASSSPAVAKPRPGTDRGGPPAPPLSLIPDGAGPPPAGRARPSEPGHGRVEHAAQRPVGAAAKRVPCPAAPPARHGVGQDGAVDEACEARDAGPDEDRQQRAAQDRPQPDPGSGREQAVVPHLDVVPGHTRLGSHAAITPPVGRQSCGAPGGPSGPSGAS